MTIAEPFGAKIGTHSREVFLGREELESYRQLEKNGRTIEVSDRLMRAQLFLAQALFAGTEVIGSAVETHSAAFREEGPPAIWAPKANHLTIVHALGAEVEMIGLRMLDNCKTDEVTVPSDSCISDLVWGQLHGTHPETIVPVDGSREVGAALAALNCAVVRIKPVN